MSAAKSIKCKASFVVLLYPNRSSFLLLTFEISASNEKNYNLICGKWCGSNKYVLGGGGVITSYPLNVIKSWRPCWLDAIMRLSKANVIIKIIQFHLLTIFIFAEFLYFALASFDYLKIICKKTFEICYFLEYSQKMAMILLYSYL